MQKKTKENLEITDLKDMLNKTKKLYGNEIAYKLKKDDCYIVYTHKEVRDIVDALGTKLIDMGLKNKRISIISENRFEWEIAYLSVVCGTGIVVPLDKALPENELRNLIAESEVEAIFCSKKYVEALERIKYTGVGKLKHIISMDLENNEEGVYSQKQLIEEGFKLVEEGNKEFINAKINPKEMSIMLFTSGTTSKSKIVALSHENICANLMDIGSIYDINSTDVFLSVLPLHHVFECTVGFLFALYVGATTTFSSGLRHIVENLKEYKVSFMACVPAIYEGIFKIIRKELIKRDKLEEILEKEEQYKNSSMEERKMAFPEIHEMLGNNIKLFLSGAAALDKSIEEKFRLLGLNIYQVYGLTETSPIVCAGTNECYKLGAIGKTVPSVQAKIVNANKEGVGELAVKGKNVMLGYYNNTKATNETVIDNWFHTGDLAKIDEDGFIIICGRKKNVIVLKNGKNIYPEEMENLLNRIEGVKESFIYGKQKNDATDDNDIKINAKIVFDRNVVKIAYGAETDEEIFNAIQKEVKDINQMMPRYKSIRGITITEKPLIKTSTNKIKRQANLDEI